MTNTSRDERGRFSSANGGASAQEAGGGNPPPENESSWQSSGAYTPPTPPRDFSAGYRALGLGSNEGANQTQVQTQQGNSAQEKTHCGHR